MSGEDMRVRTLLAQARELASALNGNLEALAREGVRAEVDVMTKFVVGLPEHQVVTVKAWRPL